MKRKIHSTNSGQVIVEYALLLVIAVGFGILLMELVEVDNRANVPAADDESGEVIKHWRSLSRKIACDERIDEGCPP